MNRITDVLGASCVGLVVGIAGMAWIGSTPNAVHAQTAVVSSLQPTDFQRGLTAAVDDICSKLTSFSVDVRVDEKTIVSASGSCRTPAPTQ